MKAYDHERPAGPAKLLARTPGLALAAVLAACTVGHDEPWGMLDFSAAPDGLERAQPLSVDGREAGSGALHLDAGPHRIVLADAADPGAGEIVVSVDVQAGKRQFVALRQAADGSWEAVVWKREPLDGSPAERP